ncbi:MAG: acyltransferase [Candidatus Nanopelagicales bacterium]
MLVGTSSWQFDVVDSDGAVQPFGSPGYARVVTQALDETFADFSADRIAITSVPCTALPPNVINDSKNDRDRTRTLNDFLRGYAGAHGYGFIDLGDVTCAPDVSGLYVDGLHYTPRGCTSHLAGSGPTDRGVRPVRSYDDHVTTRRGLAYSPALDGLRALAVIAVMLYHGGSSWLGGGFLGVDVFFVLSGFLITTLLLLEHERTERLDLVAFWGRRARRLLPALFLVLVAVLLYGAFLTGEAAATIRSDALATLFYVSNWWFIASGNSYFAQFQDPSPLTHTWSLAIEEQWYLLLPLVLVLLLPKLRSRRPLAIALGALSLLSAVEMAWLANPATDASRVYYGTDTRLQSLLVGATLAAVLTPGVLERLRVPAKWVGPAALVAVVALMVLLDERTTWLYDGGFLAVRAVFRRSAGLRPGLSAGGGGAWAGVGPGRLGGQDLLRSLPVALAGVCGAQPGPDGDGGGQPARAAVLGDVRAGHRLVLLGRDADPARRPAAVAIPPASGSADRGTFGHPRSAGRDRSVLPGACRGLPRGDRRVDHA